MKRYIGCGIWYYRLPGGSKEMIEMAIPTGNRIEDEGFVRFLIRKRMGLSRLPTGTKVWPMSDGE